MILILGLKDVLEISSEITRKDTQWLKLNRAASVPPTQSFANRILTIGYRITSRDSVLFRHANPIGGRVGWTRFWILNG